MVTRSGWKPFASFSLLSEFSSAIGQEYWHCDMKRGFQRVRKKEPAIAAILNQDTTSQRIGLLSQQGVYEFHRNTQLLDSLDGVEQVAAILQLEQELPVVRDRVLRVLASYQRQPILHGKNIHTLNRGNEGIPSPLEMRAGGVLFNLYAAIDCIFLESDGTLHILDLKTGKADFDLRQGYIYLLVARYRYPNRNAVASFYNLESCKWSEAISATSSQLDAIQANLARIAQKHEFEKKQYRENSAKFAQIFPANPDQKRCQHCQFHSVCTFSPKEVSA
jgi:hypothetical protein